MDVEADIPAGTAPSDGGEEDLGSWSHLLLPSGWVDLGPRPEELAKPSGVVVHPNPTDGGQGDRPERAVPNTDQVATRLALVPQAETVAAATFALAPGKAESTAAVCALLSPAVGGQRTTEVDRGLLEYLRGDLLPPGKSGHLLGDDAICGDDEHPASFLTPLPSIEGVDEVVAGPRHLHRRVFPLRVERVGDEP
jgi:hypothetical protein